MFFKYYLQVMTEGDGTCKEGVKPCPLDGIGRLLTLQVQGQGLAIGG